MVVPDQRLALLDRVCTLYYERDWSQDEIARELATSRSRISRLLDEARREGLVEIRVKHPLPRSAELEQELLARFNLRDARVLASGRFNDQESLRQLGHIAARYLTLLLQPGQVLAIGWGASIGQLVNAISTPSPIDLDIVQLTGAIGSLRSENDGTDLARRLAEKLGGRYHSLNAPLVVDNEKVLAALIQEKSIAEALALGGRANIALVGIGSVQPAASSLLHAGYLDEAQLDALARAGAVGAIASRHFDLQGRLLNVNWNRRIVGLPLDSLCKISRVLGIAAGKSKSRAILGALRGRYINVLFSDEDAVRGVLELDRKVGDSK